MHTRHTISNFQASLDKQPFMIGAHGFLTMYVIWKLELAVVITKLEKKNTYQLTTRYAGLSQIARVTSVSQMDPTWHSVSGLFIRVRST